MRERKSPRTTFRPERRRVEPGDGLTARPPGCGIADIAAAGVAVFGAGSTPARRRPSRHSARQILRRRDHRMGEYCVSPWLRSLPDGGLAQRRAFRRPR